jgi:hypothetical protein
MKMPKGYNSKGYNQGGASATISCLKCGTRFRGNQSKVNKSMLLHTKYNHPEHLQEMSKELKITPQDVISIQQLESMVPTNTAKFPKNSI